MNDICSCCCICNTTSCDGVMAGGSCDQFCDCDYEDYEDYEAEVDE